MTVGQFLADWCDLDQPHMLETAGELYTCWCVYAHAAGEPPGTQRRFSARLKRPWSTLGLTRERIRHARVYRGVRIARPGEVTG